MVDAADTVKGASISVVIPVFNNSASLRTLFEQLSVFEAGLAERHLKLDLIFVDDGSSDDSYAILIDHKAQRPATKLIKFTRNFGAVRAVRAGLKHASGDALSLMAADLQDSLEKLTEMVDHWQAGAKFIICVRSQRRDPIISRAFAVLYYGMLKRLILRNYPQGGFDLMLVDKTMLRYLLRGGPLVMPQLTAFWLGFQPTIIYGERPPRPHGKSTFTFAKRLKFFVDTVTTFSVVPIRFFSAVGLITALMSLAYGSYIFVNATLGNFAVQGFATLVVLISFFSGLILMMLGIIGEYLWRIVSALDDRPESVVEESRL